MKNMYRKLLTRLALPAMLIVLVAGTSMLAFAQEPAVPGPMGAVIRQQAPLATRTPEAQGRFQLDAKSAPRRVPTRVPTRTPAPARPTFSGSSTQFTNDFTVRNGWLLLEMQHRGSGNFAVWLRDAASGEQVDLLANEIASWRGRSVVLVEPGDYYLDVTADGPWQISLLNLTDLPTTTIPARFNGRSASVPAQIRSRGGRVDISMEFQGDGNFAVWLYDVNNRRRVDLLANQIGSWSGSVSIPMPAGTYLLDIQADGSWSVDLRSR